jgi:hypothetical protein
MVTGESCDRRIIGAATEIPTSAIASTTRGERDLEPLRMAEICVTWASDVIGVPKPEQAV